MGVVGVVAVGCGDVVGVGCVSMGGETEARNRPSTMLTQLSGEVTTDRRHKQWRAISGQRWQQPGWGGKCA